MGEGSCICATAAQRRDQHQRTSPRSLCSVPECAQRSVTCEEIVASSGWSCSRRGVYLRPASNSKLSRILCPVYGAGQYGLLNVILSARGESAHESSLTPHLSHVLTGVGLHFCLESSFNYNSMLRLPPAFRQCSGEKLGQPM